MASTLPGRLAARPCDALIRGGYDGVIATEYEGRRLMQDVDPFSEVEMVRRHQVLLRRLLGEIEA